jgi:membrane associated rhomboid family serine protease
MGSPARFSSDGEVTIAPNCQESVVSDCDGGGGILTPMPRHQAGAASDRFGGIRVVIALAALMWVVEAIDAIDDHRLDQYGIRPRDADGLVGIVASPFLHAGFGHLISNTVPFVLMGFAIALRGAGRVLAVTAIVGVVGGLGTWLVAPANTLHIGASGVVFGYAAYLLSRGIFDRDLPELAIGVLVGAIWGTALTSGLLPHEGISWQGHLFGAVGGVVAARLLMRDRQPAPAHAR